MNNKNYNLIMDQFKSLAVPLVATLPSWVMILKDFNILLTTFTGICGLIFMFYNARSKMLEVKEREKKAKDERDNQRAYSEPDES
jgi:hypothetical protein